MYKNLGKKIRCLIWRLRGLSIGNGSLIEGGLYIRGRSRICIGRNAYISRHVSLKASTEGYIIIGDNCLIRDGVRIQGGLGTLRIGDFFAINHNSSITFNGDLDIGNYVMIGPGVTITTSGHSFNNKEIMRFQKDTYKKIVIEDDVWIGANAVILPGVTIAKGTVVGAGSVVTKNTEPYSIVVGNHAKVIGYRGETEQCIS
ncbi:acyltransferase [Dissulfurispira thermophila]|uniref:acyltransferase n=1 Tax=Dissulfurispira thermophila TaxID=2715679 RepID=UPI00193E9A7B|nr:acyltransferase [Dissulfurispira thermophila]